MNKKEIHELSRRWKREKNSVTRIYGCYVSSVGKRMVADLDESLGTMPEEEADLYLAMLRKTLSGTQGRNLIDIEFSTAQVANSEEHRLLMELKNSRLENTEARQAFYQKVIDNLVTDEETYLILLACDSYDVPHRGKDGELHADTGDQVFTYFLCAVCPVRAGKTCLGYFPGDNEFHCAGSRTAVPPELGFLFPAFDGRASNIYNVLFYTRRPDRLHDEFIEGVFRTRAPLSAADQRDHFTAALTQALGENCTLDVVQAVHGQLTELVAQHRESKDPEPLSLSIREVGQLLLNCGIQQEQVAVFREQCSVLLGEGAPLRPANIVDTGHFEVRTSEGKVTVAPGSSYMVETRMIGGRQYLLIPAGEDVEVNGIPVRIVEETGES